MLLQPHFVSVEQERRFLVSNEGIVTVAVEVDLTSDNAILAQVGSFVIAQTYSQNHSDGNVNPEAPFNIPTRRVSSSLAAQTPHSSEQPRILPTIATAPKAGYLDWSGNGTFTILQPGTEHTRVTPAIFNRDVITVTVPYKFRTKAGSLSYRIGSIPIRTRMWVVD